MKGKKSKYVTREEIKDYDIVRFLSVTAFFLGLISFGVLLMMAGLPGKQIPQGYEEVCVEWERFTKVCRLSDKECFRLLNPTDRMKEIDIIDIGRNVEYVTQEYCTAEVWCKGSDCDKLGDLE